MHILERGPAILKADTWLLNEVYAGQFEAIADRSFRAVRLGPQATAWIPYGWSVFIVTQSANPSYILTAPMVNLRVATHALFCWSIVQFFVHLTFFLAN